MITGKTVVCGLIGDPVEHSVSPAMHNAAFQKLGLDYVYVPFRVALPDLAKALAGMRAINLRGLNVTIPHKVAVLSLLDELDPMAENLGAVNTVCNSGGCLKGFNTDARGFYLALTAAGVIPAGKRVTVLGAGGAARAVAFILADHGVRLTILNRDEDRAVTLAHALSGLFRCDVKAAGLHREKLGKIMDQTEILINTTSAGMPPQIGVSPLPSGLINSHHVVFDIIYNPLKTPLLAEAEKAGALCIGGIEMLVWQGAAAFELWTGCPAPLDVMRLAALDSLQNYQIVQGSEEEA